MHPAIHIRITTNDKQTITLDAKHPIVYQLCPFTSENVGCPSLDQALLLALAGNYRAQGKKLNLSDHLVEILESFEDNARDYLINKTNLVLPPLDSWRESSCSTSTAIKNSLHLLTDIVRK